MPASVSDTAAEYSHLTHSCMYTMDRDKTRLGDQPFSVSVRRKMLPALLRAGRQLYMFWAFVEGIFV